uniref:RPA_C domain-containing protein n=1 Tax=Strongyloides papillosus TaxID=174720 RepID=A0A0N5BKL0_STREA
MNATFDGNNWSITMDSSTLENVGDHRIKNFNEAAFTIKVEFKDLCMIPDGKDKITIGNYSFQKVGFAGKITNVEKDEAGTNYFVADTEENAQSVGKCVKCCVYENSAASSSEFVEGSIVRVFGKLHYVDGQVEVIVLGMSEIEDLAEIEVFKWESRLAKIEFGRGLLGLMYSDPSAFSGVRGYEILNTSKSDAKSDGGASNKNTISQNSDDPKSLAKRIIDHLKNSGKETFTIDEMVTHFNVAVEKISRAVELLEQDGNVFIDGDGIYGLGC